jgi:hypothetical protein
VVLTAVLRHGGYGQADGVIPECFDVEEERGIGVEVHVEDVEEGTRWRAHGGGRRGGGAGADRYVTGNERVRV